MVALRAASNLAHHDEYATSDTAWRAKLEPIADADKRRTLYLTRDQRRALIDALPDDAAAFVTGLCLLPLRPGALASLTVADFNGRDGSLRILSDKAGIGRSIFLPLSAAKLIREQAKGKLPAAPLFARWDGRAWVTGAKRRAPQRYAVKVQCDVEPALSAPEQSRLAAG